MERNVKNCQDAVRTVGTTSWQTKKMLPKYKSNIWHKKIPMKYTSSSHKSQNQKLNYQHPNVIHSHIHIFNRCNPHPTIKTAAECIPLHLNGKSCQFCSIIHIGTSLLSDDYHLSPPISSRNSDVLWYEMNSMFLRGETCPEDKGKYKVAQKSVTQLIKCTLKCS